MASYVIRQEVDATPVVDATGVVINYSVTALDGSQRLVSPAVFEALLVPAPPPPPPLPKSAGDVLSPNPPPAS